MNDPRLIIVDVLEPGEPSLPGMNQRWTG